MHRNEVNLPVLSLNVLQTQAVDLTHGQKMVSLCPHDVLIKPLFSVATGSTWCTNDSSIKPKSQHADVFRADINAFGLPMAVVLDGCGRHADPAEIQLLANHLMKMLGQLAKQLHGKSLSIDEIKVILKEKYHQLDDALQFKYSSEAVFSASFIYQDSTAQYKALSFGTGDTMIALDDGTSVKSVVMAVSTKNGAPIPFPSTNMKGGNVEAALLHLQVNLSDVKPEQRLIFLTDGAYENLNLGKSISADGSVEYRCFTSDTCLSGFSLSEASKSIQESAREKYMRQSQRSIVTLGDDATIAEMVVPTPSVQNKLAFIVELTAYIVRRTREADAQGVPLSESHFSFFSQWFTTNDGGTKVTAARKMIRALNGEEVFFDAISIRALHDSGADRTEVAPGLGQIFSKYEELGALPLAYLMSEAMYNKSTVPGQGL